MAHQDSKTPWSALRRELFAIAVDPYNLREIGRGFLPIGTLVEAASAVVRQALVLGVEIVAIRVRSDEDASIVAVMKVAADALRDALGL